VFAALGVPEIIPLVTVRPGGKVDPVAAAQLQLYGAEPPEAASANPAPAYTAPTVPEGGVPEVMVRVPALTLIV